MDGSKLNAQAFEGMMKAFDEWEHRPSEVMQNGLKSIQETLTLMLLGEAEKSYYLSSLDPGVGKSTAIIKWIDAYLICREIYGSHGIIICFDRLEEIKRFVEECNIPSDCFAVMVSDEKGHNERGKDLNSRGLGVNNANDAQLLFTTKQQIIRRSKGKLFGDTLAFYYKSKPRNVRIWDESLMVGKELTVDRFSLLGLAEDVSKTNPEIALKIEDIASELKSYKNGEVYPMPDLGLTLNSMMHSFLWSSRVKVDAAEALGMLLGRAVTVRSDDRGKVAVDCGESVPSDFVPCLVTDASGRVRDTYNLQHKYRGDLIRLNTSATKEYSNLTISVWRKASGKEAYKGGSKVYSDEIIKVIDSRPDEKFLVVRHFDHTEFEADILSQVKNPNRVRFIHWGIHTATNEYSHIPNVIISSQLTYRLAAYEAQARASATLTTADGMLSNEQLRAFRLGENAHHLLQAICRGQVRKSEGSGCPVSNVWIITSPSTMIEERLRTIFPDSNVKSWKTSPGALKGSQQKSFEFILKSIEDDAGKRVVSVPALLVRKHLGITQSNFKRDIIRNVTFNDSLAVHGIYTEPKGNRYYFVRNTFDSGIQS